MYFYLNIWICTGLTVILNVHGGNIDPFMDSQLFMINWAGPLEIIKEADENQMLMTTSNNEKYTCILPAARETKEEARKRYSGPSALELMKRLFTQTSCSYRLESYWTYELCHGKHIRQYHETKDQGQKPKLQEYYLGIADLSSLKEPSVVTTDSEDQSEIKVRKIDGISLPYFEVNMTNGTPCDLTKAPRRARVLYVCQPEGHGEIYQLKEMSTCEYEVVILTSLLCAHPDFRPKNPPVSQIQCHALNGSPPKPKQLHTLIQEEPDTDPVETEEQTQVKGETTTPDGLKKTVVIPASKAPEPLPTLGSTTDKQLIREFLSGDYCLSGGTGWWKFEFCYGKYARQYHDDKNGRTVLYLGHWNEENHKHWLQSNYHKRPKDIGKRKQISLYHGDGDVCHETGKARFTEVKLKCIENPEHPHAMALFLMEPQLCEYVLGIESPVFCSLLDKADEDGIFRNIDI